MKRRSGKYLESSLPTQEEWLKFEEDLNEYLSFKGKINPWKISPVSFEEFCLSKDHMAFPELSDSQKVSIYSLLGSEPKKVFEDSPHDISVIIAGKGSGKDTISALFLCYLIYLTLCMRNPQQYFYANDRGEYPANEAIDIVNVARSAAQASRVFFEKLKNLVKDWKWLKKDYDIKLSGKSYSVANREGELDTGKVNICADSIIFPSNVRCFSLHSDQETSEGLNVLAYVLDEYAAFKDKSQRANADKVFDVFDSSAKTRFPRRYKGLIISYPRYKDDPIMRKYKDIESGKLKRAFAIKGATWEFNPTKKKEDFLEEYDRDPEGAMCRYECIPPEQEQAFIQFPERVDQCINSREPIAHYEDDILQDVLGQRRVAKKFLFSTISKQSSRKIYKASLDMGKSVESAALTIGHLENDIIVQDLVLEWIPDKKQGLPVDFDNVFDTILHLRENYINIIEVYCDHWNSTSTLQKLSKKGIVGQEYRVTLDDYVLFRECLYTRCIDLLNVSRQTTQIKKLQIIDGKKVDHEKGGRDDLAITTCGLCKIFKGLFVKPKKKKHTNVYREGDSEEYYGTYEGDPDAMGGVGTFFKH